MFKDFIEAKDRELEAQKNPPPMDHATESAFCGTKALTTRQPPSFHAALLFLERYIPLSDRGEIIHRAIASAAQDLMEHIQSQSDGFSTGRADTAKQVYHQITRHTLDSILNAVDPDADFNERHSGQYTTTDKQAKAIEALKALPEMSDTDWLEAYAYPKQDRVKR